MTILTLSKDRQPKYNYLVKSKIPNSYICERFTVRMSDQSLQSQRPEVQCQMILEIHWIQCPKYLKDLKVSGKIV